MKKIATISLLLGLIFIAPLVLAQEPASAQEQAKIYSGFGRFVDNVKMFFSFRDDKVMLALDIRDKELNSAIVNTKNGDEEEAKKNLERAKKRLQFVQNKVSKDMAEKVKTNIDKTINKINEEENLSHNFETYILEEKKTQLTAELVVEVDGKNGKSGKNKVEITVDGNDGQTKIMEIEGRIVEIDNQITERVVNDIIEEGGSDGGLIPEVKTDGVLSEEEKNIIVEDEINDVVKDNEIKIDKVLENKENKDIAPTVNKVDDEVDSGPGAPGVIDKD